MAFLYVSFCAYNFISFSFQKLYNTDTTEGRIKTFYLSNNCSTIGDIYSLSLKCMLEIGPNVHIYTFYVKFMRQHLLTAESKLVIFVSFQFKVISLFRCVYQQQHCMVASCACPVSSMGGCSDIVLEMQRFSIGRSQFTC